MWGLGILEKRCREGKPGKEICSRIFCSAGEDFHASLQRLPGGAPKESPIVSVHGSSIKKRAVSDVAHGLPNPQ